MDSLPSKDQLYGYFKASVAKAKQYAYNLSPTELLVEEATSNDAWGPTGTQMAEITDESFDISKYKQIMGVVARRLQDTGEDWRHVYKSLLLLEFMCKHGPYKVVDELAGNMGVLTKLQDFNYKDKNGKDWGLNVRHRAKELGGLVSDPDRVRTERNKAKSNKEKYTGVSSDDWRSGGSTKKTGFGSTSGSFGTAADKGSPVGTSSLKEDSFSFQPVAGREAPEMPSVNDAVAETQKRIAALRESSPARDTIPAQAAARPAQPAEGPKGPKKLSEVRVDPSIAAQFGRLPMPKPAASPAPVAPPAAAQPAQPSTGMELLGGHILPANAAAPQTAAQPDLWGSFDAPSTGHITAESRGFSSPDPFAATFGDLSLGSSAPATQPSAPAVSDPFAALTAPAPSAPADPFAEGPQAPNPPPVPQGSGFSKPAEPPNRDPFASIAATPSTGAGSAIGHSPRAGARGAPGSPLKQGSGSPAGRPGQALPEDLFGQPSGPSGSPLGPRMGMQQQPFGQPGPFGQAPHQQQQQHFQLQQQSQPWGMAQRPQGSPTYGSFAGAPQGMQPGFGGRPGNPQNSLPGGWQGGQEPGIGLSPSDFGPTQHFAAPPQSAKKDPFAGLTGL